MRFCCLPPEPFFVDGIDTKEEDRLYDIRQTAGMVFQNPDNQLVATIVEEDVAFALENLGVPPEEIRRRVDESLKAVGHVRIPGTLSPAFQEGRSSGWPSQALSPCAPKCIVLDRPTAMLDPQGRREVLRTIRELGNQFGITVVLITHYMDRSCPV